MLEARKALLLILVELEFWAVSVFWSPQGISRGE